MALLTVSGDPASRWEEVAHGTAQILGFELVTESRLSEWISAEFGDTAIPMRAWRAAAALVLARLAAKHHLVIAIQGAENLFKEQPQWILRTRILTPEAQRVGNLMLDERLEKPDALARLNALDAECKHLRRARFGRMLFPPEAI